MYIYIYISRNVVDCCRVEGSGVQGFGSKAFTAQGRKVEGAEFEV